MVDCTYHLSNVIKCVTFSLISEKPYIHMHSSLTAVPIAALCEASSSYGNEQWLCSQRGGALVKGKVWMNGGENVFSLLGT